MAGPDPAAGVAGSTAQVGCSGPPITHALLHTRDDGAGQFCTAGWAQLERSGRIYQYRPAQTREETAAGVLREVLASTGDSDGVLLHFAQFASDHESMILHRALGERKSR